MVIDTLTALYEVIYDETISGNPFDTIKLRQLQTNFEEKHLKHTEHYGASEQTSVDKLWDVIRICQEKGFKTGYRAATRQLIHKEPYNTEILIKQYLRQLFPLNTSIKTVYEDFCEKYTGETKKHPTEEFILELDNLLESHRTHSFYVGASTAIDLFEDAAVL